MAGPLEREGVREFGEMDKPPAPGVTFEQNGRRRQSQKSRCRVGQAIWTVSGPHNDSVGIVDPPLIFIIHRHVKIISALRHFLFNLAFGPVNSIPNFVSDVLECVVCYLWNVLHLWD